VDSAAIKQLSSITRNAFAELAEHAKLLISENEEAAKLAMLLTFSHMDLVNITNNVRESGPHPLARKSDWEIIEASQGCALSDLKHSYRQRAKELHPDKLEGMDEDLRALANSKLSLLNAAYGRIIAQSRAPVDAE
jgi:hypothetical protein